MTAPHGPRQSSPLGDAALLLAQVGLGRRLARRYVQWGMTAEDAAMRSAWCVMLVSATGMGIILFAMIVLPMTLVVLADPGHGGWWLLPVKLAWLAWSWLTFGGWVLGSYAHTFNRPGTGPRWLRVLANPKVIAALLLVALPSHIVFLAIYNWVAHTLGTL